MPRSTISPLLLKAAVSQSFNAIIITDADLTDGGPHIEFCNAAFCEMTGYSVDELIGQSPRILQGARTDQAVISRLRDCLDTGQFFQGNTVNYRKNGQPYYVEWNISPVRDDTGRIAYYVSVQQDISARVEAERERDMLSRALHDMAAPVMIADGDARILFVNHTFEQLTGYRLNDIRGSVTSLLDSDADTDADVDVSPEIQHAAIARDLQHGSVLRRTVLQRRRHGDPFYLDQSLSAIRDAQGKVLYFVSIGKDVSSQVRMQERLKTLAQHDTLTGLFNRRHGETLLAEYERQAQRQDAVATVILCDIDFFKEINDRFGHQHGDETLKLASRTMRALLRSTDALVRWGGDEFLILLPDTPVEAAAVLMRTLCRNVASASAAHLNKLTLSMGLAAWSQGESSHSVLQRADRALYKAKENGRNGTQIAEPMPGVKAQ